MNCAPARSLILDITGKIARARQLENYMITKFSSAPSKFFVE